MWPRALQNAVICLVIGGLVTGAIVLGLFLRESRLPVVDFSDGAATEPSSDKSIDSHEKRLRFAVAPMLETKATFSVYQHFVRWVCRSIDYEPEFVLCSSYKQIRESLEAGQTEVAFVCTGTYVHSLSSQPLDLLAEPVYSSSFEYRCVLLVNTASPIQKIDDLHGSTMAFTDPESFTGNLVPRGLLASEGIEPEKYFKKIIYTGSHDRSIAAVAHLIADAAAVDALIWRAKCLENPALSNSMRVLWESKSFPPPPVVVPVGTDKTLKLKLQNSFLTIHKDPEGKKILEKLGIDHFKIPDIDAYKAIAVYANPAQLHGDF